MILIHTALLCEAQIIIEKYKLIKINSFPKIYKNDTMIVVVGGVGRENTRFALEYIFEKYEIKKGFNIGVAGCSDRRYEIGTLFCTNQNLKSISFMKLQTVDFPQKEISTAKGLFDMEGEYFLQIAQKYLQNRDIYIFKIVSDYLDNEKLDKNFVKKLIQNVLNDFKNYLI